VAYTRRIGIAYWMMAASGGVIGARQASSVLLPRPFTV
jgi:hypothetical protein